MGVDKTSEKKKFFFGICPEATTYYSSHANFFQSLLIKEFGRHDIVFDGSVSVETCFQKLKACENNKIPNGKTFINDFYKSFKFAIETEIMQTVVITLDSEYRPPTKINRGNDKDAKLFGEITDETFPFGKDDRQKKIDDYKSTLSHLNSFKESVAKGEKVDMPIFNSKGKLVKSKKSRVSKKQKIEKVSKNTKKSIPDMDDDDEEDEKEKEDGEDVENDDDDGSGNQSRDIKRIDRRIKKIQESIKTIEESISKSTDNFWTEGKGNPSNRRSVYRYITKKLGNLLKTVLQENTVEKTVIIENAVLLNKKTKKLEYFSLHIHTDGKKNITITPLPAVGLCEGEQLILYYHTLFAKNKHTSLIVDSSDTDLYGYFGLNNSLINNGDFELDNPYTVRLILKANHGAPNYYMVVDLGIIFEKIKSLYKNNLKDPVAAVSLFLWVLLGNDYVPKKMHKWIQKHHCGKSGTLMTETLLKKFVFEYLTKYG
jgi:hypothetical protein